MQINQAIFRAYDIRGVFNVDLDLLSTEKLGLVLGNKALSLGEDTIIVAIDGRLSSPILSQALIKGIVSSGCNAINLGLVPTPLLYFATHQLKKHSGIMITASHNPPEYNGFKIVLAGKALYGEDILALYQAIVDNNYIVHENHGLVKEYNIVNDYIKYIKNNIKLASNRKQLKIVVDCGNGAGGEVVPLLYKALNCEVIELYCTIDGTFPNHHPDPIEPNNLVDLIQAVQLHKADLGLAFDGDADRLGVVDNTGKIIWPDRYLCVFAHEILKRKPNSAIVYDVKCSNNLKAEIIKHHGVPIMWKTGHSLIKAKMKEEAAVLGGEMSGHIFFQDRWFGFDDALYAGARLLEILQDFNGTANDLFASIPESFVTGEISIPVNEDDKFNLIAAAKKLLTFDNANMTTLDGVRVDFTYGWGLIRASNTNPKLIARFEADSEQRLKEIQEQFITRLLPLGISL